MSAHTCLSYLFRAHVSLDRRQSSKLSNPKRLNGALQCGIAALKHSQTYTRQFGGWRGQLSVCLSSTISSLAPRSIRAASVSYTARISNHRRRGQRCVGVVGGSRQRGGGTVEIMARKQDSTNVPQRTSTCEHAHIDKCCSVSAWPIHKHRSVEQAERPSYSRHTRSHRHMDTLWIFPFGKLANTRQCRKCP